MDKKRVFIIFGICGFFLLLLFFLAVYFISTPGKPVFGPSDIDRLFPGDEAAYIRTKGGYAFFSGLMKTSDTSSINSFPFFNLPFLKHASPGIVDKNFFRGGEISPDLIAAALGYESSLGIYPGKKDDNARFLFVSRVNESLLFFEQLITIIGRTDEMREAKYQGLFIRTIGEEGKENVIYTIDGNLLILSNDRNIFYDALNRYIRHETGGLIGEDSFAGLLAMTGADTLVTGFIVPDRGDVVLQYFFDEETEKELFSFDRVFFSVDSLTDEIPLRDIWEAPLFDAGERDASPPPLISIYGNAPPRHLIEIGDLLGGDSTLSLLNMAVTNGEWLVSIPEGIDEGTMPGAIMVARVTPDIILSLEEAVLNKGWTEEQVTDGGYAISAASDGNSERLSFSVVEREGDSLLVIAEKREDVILLAPLVITSATGPFDRFREGGYRLFLAARPSEIARRISRNGNNDANSLSQLYDIETAPQKRTAMLDILSFFSEMVTTVKIEKGEITLNIFLKPMEEMP